jgi:glycerate kinase
MGKVLVCPDKFRGSLSAREAAAALAAGLRDVLVEAQVDEFPMSDGGDGFARLLSRHLDLELITHSVTGPVGGNVQGEFVILGDGCAVVDSASASGLALVPPESRDPLKATSRGTGELILEAVEMGCERIIVGVGGSATVDGGAGASAAMGLRLTDREGEPVRVGGGALGKVTALDTSELAFSGEDVQLMVAADVGNTLLGPTGAASVFGPQKGADPEGVILLERGLDNLAERVDRHRWGAGAPAVASAWPTQMPGFPESREVAPVGVCGHPLTGTFREYQAPMALVPGTGSAGGMAVTLAGLFGGTIVRGASTFLDITRFDERYRIADAVITGEGSFDKGSMFGKVAWEVMERCRDRKLSRVIACGSLDPAVTPEAVRAHDELTFFSLEYDLGLDEGAAMEDAGTHLAGLGRLIGRHLRHGDEPHAG